MRWRSFSYFIGKTRQYNHRDIYDVTHETLEIFSVNIYQIIVTGLNIACVTFIKKVKRMWKRILFETYRFV